MSEYTSAQKPTLTACLEFFDAAINTIMQESAYPLPQADIQDFKANITSMLRNEASPAEYFECIGHGAFKECYSAIGDWIIKFAADYNDTDAERLILKSAKEVGLSALFPNTIFIDLPCKLPIVHADMDEFSYYYDDAPHSYGCSCGECPDRRRKERTDGLITAILQPRAYTTSSQDWKKCAYSLTDYQANPLYYNSGFQVPFDLYDGLDVSSHTWLQDVIEVYGDKVFDSFCRFSEKHQLSDLHEHNTGYISTPLKDLPVLLDWLSRYSD